MESEAWAHFLEEGSLSRVLAKSWAKILHEDRPEERVEESIRLQRCRDIDEKSEGGKQGGEEREREVSRGQTIGWPRSHCQKYMVSNPWATGSH